MDKGKFIVDAEKRIVTFGHETKTMDGSVVLTTTFDFSKVKIERLLKRAADAELIGWRSKVGIKKLSTVEAAKLDNAIVDCAAITERVKHVETAEEKELRELISAAAKNGKSIKDILEMAKALTSKNAEAASQQDMDEGETVA